MLSFVREGSAIRFADKSVSHVAHLTNSFVWMTLAWRRSINTSANSPVKRLVLRRLLVAQSARYD